MTRIVPGWSLEAGLLRLFWWWTASADVAHASAKGYRLLSRIGPRLAKDRHVLGNFRVAFPDLSREQLRTLATGMWGNFGAVLAEYPHLRRLVSSEAHTEIVIAAGSQAIVANRQPAVYVGPHLGNWEMGAAILARLGIPVTTIYSPQGNPVVDGMLQSMREALGIRFVPRKNALRHLVKELRSGQSVGMLPDQRNDEGEPVPFFGVDAPTVTSPAWLAIRMNCPLIPVEIERTGSGRFRMMFHEPLDTGCGTDTRQRVLETTRRLNACFERWIRKHPEQWLCTKRRWPKAAYAAQSAPDARQTPQPLRIRNVLKRLLS